jgi:nucleoside-diphosphate-sugar epimerase
VSDLVSGILLAARHERAVGEAFNLSGPEVMTWNQYFQRFNSALGLPELRLINPESTRFRANMTERARYLVKFVLAHFEDPLKRISRRIRPASVAMKFAEKILKTSPRLNDLSFFSRDARYITTKVQNTLGYKPSFDVDTGLELTVRWLNHLGLVNLGRH